jgi:hypothetical protein
VTTPYALDPEIREALKTAFRKAGEATQALNAALDAAEQAGLVTAGSPRRHLQAAADQAAAAGTCLYTLLGRPRAPKYAETLQALDAARR